MNTKLPFLAVLTGGLALALALLPELFAKDASLRLKLRSRVQAKPDGSEFKSVVKKAEWDPKKTAIIIVDMWDDHWCKGAANRVAELAGPMNEMVKIARAKGVFVIHAPSSVVDFYKDTPQRKRAQAAPFAKTKTPLSTADRWGTKWCWPDPAHEGTFPIDDSDMGCDCPQKCKIRDAWKREISTIQIDPADAVTDQGQEAFNLLAERGIDNVILMGVHLNMCVLGRPIAIREMVKQGKNVVLVRDMTDTMYNHEMKPMVNHFAGTDLVVEHVEKYWCPSILSSDIAGGKPFRFKEDTRKR